MRTFPTLSTLVLLAAGGSLALAAGAARQAEAARPERPAQEDAPDPFARAARVRFSVLQFETASVRDGDTISTQVPAQTIERIHLVDTEGDGLWLEVHFHNGDYSLHRAHGVNLLRQGTQTSEVLVSRGRKASLRWPLVN